MELVLFLHVLAGFAAVAAVVVFTVMVLSARDAAVAADSPALGLTSLARRLWDVGGAGTLLLGVWLALDSYDILDGWILAAFVLWLIAGGTGAQLGAAFTEARDSGDTAPLRDARTLALYAVMTIAVAALLADMIYKPGL